MAREMRVLFALVLLTRPRCALILYLGLGCSAAGLPIEKLVSHARRLSADACATETAAFLICAGNATIGATLLYENASCEGSDQGTNLGTPASVDECAVSAAAAG